MIYGKPLMIYGTKICAVSFYGPPGSTVTWGSDPGESVTLNEYGIGGAELDRGTYTFVNTVSVGGSTLTAYTLTNYRVNKSETLYLYPAGAIYWFGTIPTGNNLLQNIADGANYGNQTGWGTKTAMTSQTNRVYGKTKLDYNNSKECIKWGSAKSVDVSSFSSLKAKAIIHWDTVGTASQKRDEWMLMADTGTPATDKNLNTPAYSYRYGSEESDGTTPIDLFDLSEITGRFYIGGLFGYYYARYHNVEASIVALWMD